MKWTTSTLYSRDIFKKRLQLRNCKLVIIEIVDK